ncbi:MAG: hypothetical protein GXY33_18385 [Phycisphaerae bacterium]|nr:hypothetical protein [Phycisphaerae bacterium]
MRDRSLLNRMASLNVTIGGSGTGQPLPVVVLTVVVVVMALITVYKTSISPGGGIDLSKEIPFKCKACNEIVNKTLRDLQQMEETQQMGPMMGPMKLVCPKCGKKELTQAVKCPKCEEVFIFEMDPMAGASFDDRCPKCGVSYSEAWQEKYRKGK